MQAACVVLLAVAGSLGPGEDEAAPVPSGPPVLLVLPAQARRGGNPFVGETLAQLLVAALERDGRGFAVKGQERMLAARGDPLLTELVRCTEAPCAAELGRRVGADQVIVGQLEGSGSASRLTMWRVGVERGDVLAMHAWTLTETTVDQLSIHPEVMLDALLAVPDAAGAESPPAAAARSPRSAEVTRPRLALVRAVALVGAGAAGAFLAATGLGLAGYTAVVFLDAGAALRGRHAVTQPVALAMDGLAALAFLGAVLAVPVLLLAGGTAALSWVWPVP